MSVLKFWFGIFSLGFLRLHFGGSSRSSSASNTYNTDSRNAVQDGIAVSGNGSSVGVYDLSNKVTNITDGGIVSRALQSIDTSNVLGLGFADTSMRNALGFADTSMRNALGTINANNQQSYGLAGQALDSNTDVISRAFANNADTYSRAIGSNNDVISMALDSVNLANANGADGFTALLGAAESLWNRGENMIGQTQQAVADAYTNAQSDKSGTIDNRTIIVLAVAGAAALAFMGRGK